VDGKMLKAIDLAEVRPMVVKGETVEDVNRFIDGYNKGMERALNEVALVKLIELEERRGIDPMTDKDVLEAYAKVQKLKNQLISKYGIEISNDLMELEDAFTYLSANECGVYFKKGFVEGYKFKDTVTK
jgi:hypothetical protein